MPVTRRREAPRAGKGALPLLLLAPSVAAPAAPKALGPWSFTADDVFDAFLAQWTAYADAHGHVAEDGVEQFASAIDNARAQMAAMADAKAKPGAQFISAVKYFFGDTVAGYAAKVVHILQSLGGEEEHYSQANVDRAIDLANQLASEGWPLWPAMAAHYVDSPYTLAEFYSSQLQAYRSAPSDLQAAARALWQANVLHSDAQDIAFVNRFSVAVLVDSAAGGPRLGNAAVEDAAAYDGALASVPAYAMIAAAAAGVDARAVSRAALSRLVADGVLPGTDHGPASARQTEMRAMRATLDAASGLASGGKFTRVSSVAPFSPSTVETKTSNAGTFVAVTAGTAVVGGLTWFALRAAGKLPKWLGGRSRARQR